MTITVELEIDNHYERGGAVTTHATVHVPPPADGDLHGEWRETYIWPETGTGQIDGNASYFVEVTASSDTTVIPVGTAWEWC